MAVIVKAPDGKSYRVDAGGGSTGVGVPAGGATGQFLAKASDADFDIKWSTSACPYRIGDVLQTENPTHPAESWPGTEWEELTGRFLLGRNEGRVVGTEGGEESHTLTVAEMPSHNHAIYIDEAGSGGVWGPLNCVQQSKNRKTGADNRGGSQPHNNMPPYRVVYIWKRTA